MRDDNAVSAAFDKGRSAGEADKPSSNNPYMPEAEEELWLAWTSGWNEANPRYVRRVNSGAGTVF